MSIKNSADNIGGLGNTKPKGTESQALDKKLVDYNIIKNDLLKNNEYSEIIDNDDVNVKTGKASNFKRKNWFFTIPYKTYLCNGNTYKTLGEILKAHIHISMFAYQAEKGDSGYEHIQGIASFKKEVAFSYIKSLIGDYAHILAVKNVDASYRYCTKIRSRMITPICLNYKPIIPNENFENIINNPYKWQKMIIETIINTRDKRYIYWFWSKKGNTGKSTFCKYLEEYYNACLIGGYDKDAAYMLDEYSDIFIFDIPRGDGANIDYKLLEKIKDNRIYSTKYESRTKKTLENLLFVFANNEPDKHHNLSEDRLKVFNIDN